MDIVHIVDHIILLGDTNFNLLDILLPEGKFLLNELKSLWLCQLITKRTGVTEMSVRVYNT